MSRCFLFMRCYFLMRLTFLTFTVVLLLVLCYPHSMGIASVNKVAILPFQMNADEDIDYINRAVRDMLTSRIAYGAEVAVVEQSVVKDALSKVGSGKLTKKRVQEIGSNLGVDYVVFGSITKIGNNVSIDISVLNVLQGGITTTVFTQSIGLNEVIPKMNGLAQGIKDVISAGFESLSPVTTSIPPSEVDETFLEEESKGGEMVPSGIEEVNLTASDGALKMPEPPSDEVRHGLESGQEPLGEQSAEPKGLKENFLQRKSDINSLDENPVYQKSVDDLDEIPEATPKEISE